MADSNLPSAGSLGVLKTIILFLQSHDFPEAADALKMEVESSGFNLAAVPAKSVMLRRCKCSRNVANQTDLERHLNGFLEGTFEGEPQQLKDDGVHVVYVCDHQSPNVRPKDSEWSAKSDICQLKNKFSQLHREHQRLIAVTSELTSTIQLNVVSQTENISSALEQCKTIYPGLFTDPRHNQTPLMVIKSEETTPNPPEEPLNLETLESRTPLTPETVRKVLDTVFDRIFAPEPSRSVRSAPLHRGDVQKIVDDVLDDVAASPVKIDGSGEGGAWRGGRWFEIDYAKVKRDLLNSDSQQKVKILQALRWRVTKSDLTERQRTMESFAQNDIFELRRDVSVPERLTTEDPRVQESVFRLINAMASLRHGRDYLTTDDKILKRTLLKMARDIRTISSSVVRDMLVASIQKLSIRKQCRAAIVREGLLELLVDYLDDFYDVLSKYCLEYATALLMNLCLVDEAKTRAAKMSKKVVAMLKKFLDGDKTYCLHYVNAVMFSLLERPELVDEALHQDLDKTVVRLIRTTANDNVRKQLDFIVQCRLLGRQDPAVEAKEPKPCEEVDLLEAELDQDDIDTSPPRGEDFLEGYRSPELHLGLPSSARTFSEETKQLHHKPSSERGIFDAGQPKTFDNPRGLIRHFMNNKTNRVGGSRWPSTPICYMEPLQPLRADQSRYSCGCYDAIRKEVAEDGLNEFETSTARRRDGGSGPCGVCGDKVCDCAFEPRPKLCRTPTVS
ncbi:uncharacterized protein LOC132702320 isoform X2 [Cylas formicarius]|uniref:uncharacterized protein LOC132702320 isoform X2 n=1 Tax=Cylas formicarius TaxID=197179 RepID=UPI0029588652|nr:uncharacterized protein LOC132702320 isoform X2 [Cylas formicarius]